jgi:hypothetical protein
LRRLVLTDELLALPQLVRELADAQARTEARIEELAQAQARTEAWVEELAQAQARTEAEIHNLAEAQTRTEEILHLVANRQNQMRGDLLAMRYAGHAYAYFGRVLRRVQVFLPTSSLQGELEDLLEQHLTADELDEVFWLDLLARGRSRPTLPPVDQEIWVAVEVSAVVDRGDVERADRRAALLRKAGLRAIPAVAGEGLTQGATALLQDLPVVMILDGRSEGWRQALAAI